MKKQFILLIALLFSGYAIGQNPGTIKGSVIDSETKEALIGATVHIELGGELMGTVTDLDGKFTIKPVPPGVYTLYISFVGYNNIVQNEVRVLPDKIHFEDNLEMSFASIDIGPIDVYGVSPERMFDKDDPKKTTMVQSQIKQRADRRDLKSMVTNLGPGVTRSADGQDLHFRGSRSMAFNYYVDGIKIEATQQVNIPSRAISSLSVYAGGVPAKYGDVTGGVIVIETMTYGELYRQWKAHNM